MAAYGSNSLAVRFQWEIANAAETKSYEMPPGGPQYGSFMPGGKETLPGSIPQRSSTRNSAKRRSCSTPGFWRSSKTARLGCGGKPGGFAAVLINPPLTQLVPA
jgi:hypothetical protein